MIPVLAACFILFLVLGVPISILLVATTTIGLFFFTHTPLTILIQQLFNALDTYVLLAIPFFILAGRLMAEGGSSDRLIKVALS